ncbi:MAG: hypothetical protein JW913_16840 [Chitinispirillaceae bacterium]|nr:hypothetical protein [Chitinispirillaceae bacterium]
MGGRKPVPIFLRDAIYYARVNGNRWSTETGDEQEALRRRPFMIARNKPWAELKQNQGDQIIIRIDTEGRTYAEPIQHYTEPASAIQAFKRNTPTVTDIPGFAITTVHGGNGFVFT